MSVAAPVKFRPPQQPARVLRPSAKVRQQAVKDGWRRRFAHAQRLAGSQDRPFRRVGRAGHMRTKPRQAGDFRRQVPGGEGLPCAIGPLAASRRPQRLPPVEMSACPEPDGAFDDGWPVDAACLCGKVGDTWQRGRRGPGRGGGGLELRDIVRPKRRCGRGKGVRQIPVGDPSRLDVAQDILPCAGQRDPGHPRQAGGGGGEILAALAEKRVHRDGGIERKGGRHGPHGLLRGGKQRRRPRRRDLADGPEHDRLPSRHCDFAVSNPPIRRSRSALR